MTTAERMRKYRARKALRDACDRAAKQGLDVAGIVSEHLETRRAERELRDAMKAAVAEARESA